LIVRFCRVSAYLPQDCFQFAPELGLKTTVGAVCFAEEKAKKNAELIEQVSEKFYHIKTVLTKLFC